jgi:hypothetical protein|tara:strand:+ start:345 stop:497 length:153 start_codon:yes stop_codon:yes gene_type:complete
MVYYVKDSNDKIIAVATNFKDAEAIARDTTTVDKERVYLERPKKVDNDKV